MSTPITVEQLNQYRDTINTKGVEGAKEVYQLLYSQGYNYAGWAYGVASGETLTGRYALDYLTGSALMGLGGDSCRNLSESEINKIRQDMAVSYLDSLLKIAKDNGNIVDRDVKFTETKDFHAEVFGKNDLTNDNWTLEIPMELMRQEYGDAYVENLWNKLRDTGGDDFDSLFVTNTEIMMYMAQKNFIDGDPQAKEWFDIVIGKELVPIIEKMWELSFPTDSDLPEPPPPELPPPPPRDPLTLDLNGDDVVNTLPMSRGIHFDLDNSGFAEQTSWVAPEDGLLVLDRNNNNFIDGGAELFGTETLLENGKYAVHGFEALAEFDANSDGVIDSGDAIYTSIKVWRDANSNGIADSGELKNLNELDIKSIGTTYTNITTRDVNNVEHREAGTFTYNNSTQGITNTLWFESDRRITVPVTELQGNAPISDVIKRLPNVVGFGNTYSLHQAMAIDVSGDLQKKVQRFSVELNPVKRRELLREILVLWTGTGGVVAGSRGDEIDATSLAILESFWGQSALQYEPFGAYAASVNEAYVHLEQSAYSQLMASTHMRDLLSLTEFTEVNGSWVADYSVVVELFVNDFLAGNEFAEIHLADFVDTIRGIDPYSDTLYSPLTSELSRAIFKLPAESRAAMLSSFVVTRDLTHGSSSADISAGHGGSIIIVGDDDNKSFYGGPGDDTYIINRGGHVRIWDYEGANTLIFAEGISREDLIIGVDSYGSLSLQYTDGTYILIGHMFRNFNDEDQLNDTATFKNIIFNASDVWDINGALNYATAGDDYLFDYSGASGISGLQGNDDIRGYSGNDTLAGGEGDDRLDGGYGGDILYGDLGNDTLHGDEGGDVLDGGPGDDHMWGGDGNDALIGGPGNDYLNPGKGDDSYYYSLGDGSDTIVGGAGYNVLYLGAGISMEDVKQNLNVYRNSIEIELNSSDKITLRDVFVDRDFSKDDGAISLITPVRLIRFENGDELSLAQIVGDVSFDGDSDNNVIFGFDGDEILRGMDGADTLYGRAGNDTLVGGVGHDLLVGGGGNDVYYFEKGDFLDGDSIDEYSSALRQFSGHDRIVFGAGIVPEDVDVIRNGRVIRLNFGENGYVDLLNSLDENGSPHGVETIEFDNNTIWTIQDAVARSRISNHSGKEINGFSSADYIQSPSLGNWVLSGRDGNDTLVAGVGSDTLYGGYGDDRYIVNALERYKLIRDDGGNDVIQFGVGIDPNDLMVFKNEHHLYFFNRKGQFVVIEDRYASQKIENVEFANGDIWNATIIQHKIESTKLLTDVVVANNLAAKPTEASHIIGLNSRYIYGGDGNDTLVSALANSEIVYMEGGEGIDNFIVNHGVRRIVKFNYSSESIVFPNISNLDDLDFYVTNNFGHQTDANPRSMLHLTDKSGMATAQIANSIVEYKKSTDGDKTYYISPESAAHRFIVLADGNSYSFNDLLALKNRGTNGNDNIRLVGQDDIVDAGTGNDTISGSGGNDTLKGGDGDDQIYGGSGNDQIYGGDGNDELMGGYGDDYIDGGAGNDTLYGQYGLDTLMGGAGDDLLYSRGLNDDPKVFGAGPVKTTYLYRLGDGNDTIVEQDGGDKIIFGQGIDANDIEFEQVRDNDSSSDHLLIKIRQGGSILIKNSLSKDGAPDYGFVEKIEFFSGLAWDKNTIVAKITDGDEVAPPMPTADFNLLGKVVAGFAEVNSLIEVKSSNGMLLGSGPTDSTSGAYTITLATALINNELVNVTAKDAAGNISAIKEIVAPDKTAPMVPTATIDVTRKIISGMAEAGSTVEVKSTSGAVLGSINANATTGDYSITLGIALAFNQTVHVTAKDLAGNISPLNAVIASGVTDTIPPAQPTAVFDLTGNVISGAAEAGSVVVVKNATNTSTLGTVTADATTGAYSVTLVTALINKETVNVTATDAAGNVSAALALVAPGATTPNPTAITIQAENYTSMSGVQTENTSDAGGGLNAGWLDAGDWMAYNAAFNVPAEGRYRVTYRVASLNGGGRITLKDLSTDAALGSIAVPKTSGWQNWVDVTQEITLNGGDHNFKLAVDVGGFNVNWFKLEPLAPVVADTTPPAQPTAVFDLTGNVISGVAETGSVVVVKNATNTSTLGTVTAHGITGAYSITLVTALINKETVNVTATDAAGNVSAALALVAPGATTPNPTAITIQAENYTSMSGVQKENTSDVGGGQNAGYIDAGDWMAYNNAAFNVPAEGRYKVTYRVASLNGGGRLTLKELSNDSTLGSITIPRTGAWQSWVDVTHEITLSGGEHNFKLAVDTGGFNINWFKLEPVAATGPITIDTTPPAQPTAIFDSAGKVISGVAEAGSIVVVKNTNNTSTLGTVTADATTGAYSITLATALINKETVNVSATDAAGNISSIKAIIAPDKTAPVAPTVNLDIVSKIVSGIAEAGSSVTVKDSEGQTLGVVQANVTTGVYSVSFTQTLINGQSIFTTATDDAGNISATTATPIIINADPLPIGNGLRGSYYGYHQPTNGNVNLTNVAQVRTLISNKAPDASFIGKDFRYGVTGANDLGMGTTLQSFLKTDAASLNTDPANTSDAILKFDGKIQLNAGSYNFRVRADDGYSILVNGTVVAEYNANQAATTRTHGTFTITQSGLQDIEIVYWDAGGGAFLNVELANTATGNYAYLDESILFQPSATVPAAMVAETNRPRTDYEGVNHYSSNDALIQAMASFVSGSGIDTRYRSTQSEQSPLVIAVGS